MDIVMDPELTKVTLRYVAMAEAALLERNYEEGEMSEAMDDRVLRARANKEDWPDPTPEMLKTSAFGAVWKTIRTWDINVPDVDGELYTGATGNHVRAILDALPRVELLKLEMLMAYGIESVYVGHVQYAPDETIKHKCAVHVIYRDGRTVCITDKVSERGSEGEVLKEGDKVPAGVVL